ncbi:MAG: hypothetical protein H0W99_07110 [Acidobacteria bacterium]|nr:hypothetical protein [Acidobacteriota bacterium]
MKASRLLALTILLFTYSALDARAQDPQTTQPPPDTIIINPNNRILITPNDQIRSPIETRAKIPVESTLPPDTKETVGPYTIRVRVRYKKGYGYLYADTYDNNRPFSCIAFVAKATVLVGAPGSFGQDKPVGVLTSHSPMREGNGYYSCWYTFTDLPIDRSISISAPVRDMQQYSTGRWLGGTEPQPPAGYDRTVIGNRSVTLKYNQPGFTVDLEMVYRLIPQGPR